MLLNIDNIPYVGRHGKVEYRTSHAIAMYVDRYLSDEDVFYVEFFNGTDLLHADLTSYVKPDILKQIQNNQIKIAFHNIHEGFNNISISILKLVAKYGIPTKNVIIITANHDLKIWTERAAQRINTQVPRIVLCESFEITASRTLDYFISKIGSMEAWIKYTYHPDSITHQYLNLNRRQRCHRPMLVCALIAKDLLETGKVSFGNSDFGEGEGNTQSEIIDNVPAYWQAQPDLRKLIIQSRRKILDSLPLYLDTTDLVTNRASSIPTDSELYKQTLMSVVSETTFFSHTCPWGIKMPEPGVFFSEKSWKPILHHQPWIMVSQPYTLQAMKHKGYQTFNEFLDESYDYEENDHQRMFMVLRLIEKISKWTPEKNREFVEYTKPILRHNIELLHTKLSTGDFLGEL